MLPGLTPLPMHSMFGADAQTQLLLHGDGANGGTTITDSSKNNYTMNVTAVTTSTAAKKFGPTSMSFNGTSSQLTVPASLSTFNLGTGDFTVECWFNPSSVSGVRYLVDFRNSAANQFFMRTNGTLIEIGFNSLVKIIGATLSTGTWYYVKYYRTGGTGYLWLNGSLVGSVADTTSYTASPTNRPIIGRNGTAANSYISGYLDELRIVVGKAEVGGGVPKQPWS